MITENTDKERIAVLETQVLQLRDELKEISGKLDQLLDLKSKGMGAIWLIGLLLGFGGFGLVSVITGLFTKSHL